MESASPKSKHGKGEASRRVGGFDVSKSRHLQSVINFVEPFWKPHLCRQAIFVPRTPTRAIRDTFPHCQRQKSWFGERLCRIFLNWVLIFGNLRVQSGGGRNLGWSGNWAFSRSDHINDQILAADRSWEQIRHHASDGTKHIALGSCQCQCQCQWDQRGLLS
jgi:hypothetical protein